jgi:hypothetical protein
LKQNACFRCVYKWPFTVKNACLLLLQIILLGTIYLLYFRADGGSVSAALKILKGLNSNTFNYLDTHRETLNVDRKMPFFDYLSSTSIDTISFFSQCVRVNKPCVIDRLAANWRAKDYWRTGGESTNSAGEEIGIEYLRKLIGSETQVRTFDFDQKKLERLYDKNKAYSFKTASKHDMGYGLFLDSIAGESVPGQHTMKEGRRWEDSSAGHVKDELILKNIMQDIDMDSLSFYKDVAEIEGIELMQGSLMVERPHYEKREQLICLLDGVMDMFIVPHV